MSKSERVVENLNKALHSLFLRDPHVYMLGEDILDPYGGAFKVSKGLSSKYPDRVLTTPLSEAAILGVASGLALCREKVIIEIMFGDFIALVFDQLLNFATKSVSMYGQKLPLNVIIRCPVGGNRSYGPTHSQSLQKHFIGIPNLHLFEVSQFHDNVALLEKLISLDHPSILFEDKILYTQKMYDENGVDDLFHIDFIDQEQNFARVFIDEPIERFCVIISPGGLAQRALAAARNLFLNLELSCQIIIPSQLYPFPLAPLLRTLEAAEHICIVEESVSGGTWGGEIGQLIYDRLWGRLKHKILLVHSKNSIIPSAAHLERQVLVQDIDIYRTLKEAVFA